MIEFWDSKAIMGIADINLNNIKNISKNILECNIEPVCLYDSFIPVKNIFTQK
jgi:hypothetical protein